MTKGKKQTYDYNDRGNKLEGKDALLLVAHEFEDMEVMYMIYRLWEEGASVTIATLTPGGGHFHARPWFDDKPVTGRFGASIPICIIHNEDMFKYKDISEVNPDNYDLAVITGGVAPDYLRLDDDTLKIVAEMYKDDKVIATVCHGMQVCISVDDVYGTDIVKGKDVTGWKSIRTDMENAGGNYIEDVLVTRDGNVIYGLNADSMTQFAMAIFDAFEVKEG